MALPSAAGSSAWRRKSTPGCMKQKFQFAQRPSSKAPPRKTNPLSGSAQVKKGTSALSAGGWRTAAASWVKPK